MRPTFDRSGDAVAGRTRPRRGFEAETAVCRRLRTLASVDIRMAGPMLRELSVDAQALEAVGCSE